MDLWQEILRGVLEGGKVEIYFPQIVEAEKLFEMRCYRALAEIKKIIEDDSLDDPTCFFKIEAIVRVFEEMGSDGGSRHDF